MPDIQIDGSLYSKRIGLIHKAIAAKRPSLNGADSIFVIIGKTDEDNPYRKSAVLHTWLLGYEFPTTALLITKTETIIITSAGKAKYLTKDVQSPTTLVWTRSKDAAHNEKLFKDLLAKIAEAGVCVFSSQTDEH